MALLRIPTSFNVDLEFEIAPFHKRLLAYFIDFALLICYLYVIKFTLYNLLEMDLRENIGFDIIAISIPMLLYPLICEILFNGQSLGKMLLKIRVVSMSGGEPSVSQYIIRWVTRFFEWPFLFGYVVLSGPAIYAYIFITAFLGLGVLIIMTVTPRSQRLGDLAAGTVVVNTRTDFNIGDTVFMETASVGYTPKYPQVMQLSDTDINTIKMVLTRSRKSRNSELCMRVQYRIQQVLQIQSDESAEEFLERLLEDYNYLATRE